MERRTRTGGTADQNGWNGGPERVERRTSTQRGNFDVFGGVALRQENELIFARKRDFGGGALLAQKPGFCAAKPRFLRSPRGD